MDDFETIRERLRRITNAIKSGKLNFHENPHQYQLAMTEKARLQAILEEKKIAGMQVKVKIAKAEARKRKNGMIFRQGMVVWKFFPDVDPKILELKLREKFGDKPLIIEEEKSRL